MKSHLRHICLVGLSGSGKSTAGRIAAKQMKRRFVDVDQLIEQQQQSTIKEIFRRRGERFFRTLERRVILSALDSNAVPSVIAIGGGGFEDNRTRKTLLEETTVVYLKSSVSIVLKRLRASTDRPLLDLPSGERTSKARALLAIRKANYEHAHLTVVTSTRTAAEVAREICRKCKAYEETYL